MDGEWVTLLTRLKGVLGERNFTLWIEPIRWLRREDEVVLEVPTQFHREWLSRHLLETIEEVLRASLGGEKPLRIALSVRGDGQGANESAPSAATTHAVRPRARRNKPVVQVGRLVQGYDFDSFVVGPTNELAAAASQAVASDPGGRFNPLFIWGGVGLGKTHLVNAIGHAVLGRPSGGRVACLSAEMFTNMMIQALRGDKMTEFRERFRELDVLIVDDVQFLAGKERTQEEFFHTFEWLAGARKQVVLTSDQPPAALGGFEVRLRSRFESGLLAEVQPPTAEMRIEIVQRKAGRRGHTLTEALAGAIVRRCGATVRELEGGLNRVLAFVEIMQRPVSEELVEQLLGPERIEPVRREMSIAAIRQAVAEYFQLSVADLVGHTRGKRVSEARHMAMYLCRTIARASFSQIATEFGGRDHSSVLYAVRVAEERRTRDASWMQALETLQKRLCARPAEQLVARRP
ncbi:MAG: chromosomal replication initiator protein DnaA [Candidatus Binatia bacterium]|nr:MAG: chromosomal replication initiator protein DnaA [Candidatus Binatia bacterium]